MKCNALIKGHNSLYKFDKGIASLQFGGERGGTKCQILIRGGGSKIFIQVIPITQYKYIQKYSGTFVASRALLYKWGGAPP